MDETETKMVAVPVKTTPRTNFLPLVIFAGALASAALIYMADSPSTAPQPAVPSPPPASTGTN